MFGNLHGHGTHGNDRVLLVLDLQHLHNMGCRRTTHTMERCLIVCKLLVLQLSEIPQTTAGGVRDLQTAVSAAREDTSPLETSPSKLNGAHRKLGADVN
jgi:hypothetical protein